MFYILSTLWYLKGLLICKFVSFLNLAKFSSIISYFSIIIFLLSFTLHLFF